MLTSFKEPCSEFLVVSASRKRTDWLKRVLTTGSESSIRPIRVQSTARESLSAPVRFTCWHRWGRASRKAGSEMYKMFKKTAAVN